MTVLGLFGDPPLIPAEIAPLVTTAEVLFGIPTSVGAALASGEATGIEATLAGEGEAGVSRSATAVAPGCSVALAAGVAGAREVLSTHMDGLDVLAEASGEMLALEGELGDLKHQLEVQRQEVARLSMMSARSISTEEAADQW